MTEERSLVKRLLDREVDRREFIGYVGAAALAALGVNSVLKALGHHEVKRGGYGGGSYGGRESRSSLTSRRQ